MDGVCACAPSRHSPQVAHPQRSPALAEVSLRHNKLEQLPARFELGHPRERLRLHLLGNSRALSDKETPESLLAHVKRLRMEGEHLQRAAVLLMGNGAHGKSTLADLLADRVPFPSGDSRATLARPPTLPTTRAHGRPAFSADIKRWSRDDVEDWMVNRSGVPELVRCVARAKSARYRDADPVGAVLQQLLNPALVEPTRLALVHLKETGDINDALTRVDRAVRATLDSCARAAESESSGVAWPHWRDVWSRAQRRLSFSTSPRTPCAHAS